MQVYEVALGAKLNVAKSTCLTMGELGDLGSLGVSVPHEVKILGMEFNPKLSGRTVWEKMEVKVQLASGGRVKDQALPADQVTGRGRPEPYKPQVEKAKKVAEKESADNYGAAVAASLGRICQAVGQKHNHRW
ncbi:hypothetical protein Y1Q_0000929 [Alligator mississippiensis]|uniref:Uncharacterized protein n=1 Tax=Alligator mississippiensis TaxID=8496 RepID=A0A151NEQ5_ALLMI|nr:hypothetical protein Y1Q_0000929 [Alligator mississippiensis]